MKKLSYELIDGYKVIRSLGARRIDRVASQKSIKDLIEKTEEFKKFKEIKRKIIAKNGTYRPTQKSVEAYKAVQEKAKILGSEIIVFFDLKSNEEEVTREKFKELAGLVKECQKEGKVLTVDGQKIFDKRGRKYFLEENGSFAEYTIDKIAADFPPNAILTLSDKQKNIMDNGATKQKEVDQILEEAIKMRSKLEITGATPESALADSKSFYEAELVKIEEKYA